MPTNVRNSRSALAADFAATNPWLGEGEERVESDTGKSKIGPGYWNSLSYGAGQDGGGSGASEQGSFISKAVAGGTETATIDAAAGGAILGARVSATVGKTAEISINQYGLGAFAAGYAKDGGAIKAKAYGSFAQGYASGDGSEVSTSSQASFAQGYATGGGTIKTFGAGFAQGYAITGGAIDARSAGFAQGYVRGAGSLIKSLVGFAQGYADAAGQLFAQLGGFAQGYVSGAYSTIHAFGGFAQGFATGAGAIIDASVKGSFAQGYATAGVSIAASAFNAAQFGPGTNAQANSLQVGNGGIRLLGKAGVQPQTTFQNGDIWVGADNHVKIRSNGATVSI